MSKKEFAKIYWVLSNAYEWFDANDTGKLAVWYEFFKTDDYELVIAAVQKFISSSVKPPTIAGIRNEIMKIQSPETLIAAGEAWQMVQKVIRNYGSYRQKEAIAELAEVSAAVAKTAEAMGFRNLCFSENQTADRARFFQTYDAIIFRTQNQEMVPSDIQKKIELMGSPRITEQGEKGLSANSMGVQRNGAGVVGLREGVKKKKP